MPSRCKSSLGLQAWTIHPCIETQLLLEEWEQQGLGHLVLPGFDAMSYINYTKSFKLLDKYAWMVLYCISLALGIWPTYSLFGWSSPLVLAFRVELGLMCY